MTILTPDNQEIETPRQFEEHFRFPADKNPAYNTVDIDICLCQCDVETTLARHGITWKNHGTYLEVFFGHIGNE